MLADSVWNKKQDPGRDSRVFPGHSSRRSGGPRPGEYPDRLGSSYGRRYASLSAVVTKFHDPGCPEAILDAVLDALRPARTANAD